MSGLSPVLIILFMATVIVLPLIAYAIVNFEAPTDIRKSIKDRVVVVIVVGCLSIGLNVFRYGSAIAEWQWGYLIGILIAGCVGVLIDWFIIRHRRGSAK